MLSSAARLKGSVGFKSCPLRTTRWKAQQDSKRITISPGQTGGVPSIRGLRIPVATVVDMVADGMSEDEILAAYPDLEIEDVREALHLRGCERLRPASPFLRR